ncbi:hypothetical protein I4U23_009195 [Adineta vaga]|nr:hypothetical protein I4U23_009195 [Adineta vaga]
MTSDIEKDANVYTSDRSGVTTEDEFFNELLNAPPEFEDCLIPDKCPNEFVALEHLTRCLNRRFCTYPAVFMGPLKDALIEALSPKDINERRPLLVYINNDKSVYTNLFCKQLLCNEKTVEYLMSNYVLWAWDVTYESNERKLNDILKNAFAPWSINKQFQSDAIDQYPLLFVVYRDINGAFTFRYLLEGSNKKQSLNEFLNSLSEFKTQFYTYEQQMEAAKEEAKRQTLLNLFQSRSVHDRRRDRHFLRSISMLPHSNNNNQLNVNQSKFARLYSGDIHMSSHKPFSGQYPTTEDLKRAFEQCEFESDDADDEDEERTPTVGHSKPKFP